MSDSSVPPTADLLAQHAEWMRALARRLVADGHLADDLAQDAMVKALERPPGDASRLRGWLHRVLSSRLREEQAARRARHRREAARARDEAEPSTEALVDRVHTQRRLADALIELEEPYRTAVLLRFYDDLPPRQIAARQQVPIATVKSRLNRGLAKLRTRLDADYGDRRAWVTALGPWLLQPSTMPLAATAVAAGGLLLNVKAWLVVLLLTVVAATGTWLWWPAAGASTPAPVDEVATPIGAGRGSRGGDSRRGPGATPRRAPLQAPVAARPRSARDEPVATEPHPVRGRVFDTDARPVPGVSVRLQEVPDHSVKTAADGSFELSTTAPRVAVEIADPEWVAVRTGSWSLDGALDPVLVVARAISVQGNAVDEWGRGVPGVRLTLALPADFGQRFDQALDASFLQEWVVTSDAGGGFALVEVPAITGAQLRAVHDDYEPVVMPAPTQPSSRLVVELRTPNIPEGRALRGVVRFADRAPAVDALVALGYATVRTDARGLFTLDLGAAGDAETISAVAPGHLPATLARPAAQSDGRSGWPGFVELWLGAPAFSIAGRVVGEDGAPKAGARVWLGDPSRFGVVGTFPLRLEALVAGGEVPTEAIDSLATRTAGGSAGSARPASRRDALAYWVETDAEGRFELPGLLERSYTLNVADPGLHFGAIKESVPAGSRNVEIVVPDGVAYPRVRGRVRTEAGDPVPGVTITTWVPAVHFVEPIGGGGSADVMRFFLGDSTKTDAEGRFELIELPRQHVQLHLVSDQIAPAYASVDQIRDPDAFDVEVLARVHLEVEVAAREGAPEHIQAVDDAGSIVPFLAMRADGYSHLSQVTLVNGRSGVLTITSNAVSLQFLRGGEVVDAMPISPRPGQSLQIQR
ncbi:MAG: sigma-70 family RNA polymerase sigma factor [Planctomycetota bacterium]